MQIPVVGMRADEAHCARSKCRSYSAAQSAVCECVDRSEVGIQAEQAELEFLDFPSRVG